MATGRVLRPISMVTLAAVCLMTNGFVGPRPGAQVSPAPPVHDAAHVLNYPYIGADWLSSFDPATAPGPSVVSMLYANLVKLNSANRVVPDLARSWTVDPSGTVYTFHLRADARFSDGTPITADDVIYSLDRALNPKALNGKAPSPVALVYLGHIVGASTYRGLGTVRGVMKIDPHTVRITIDRPIAFFLQALSYPTGDVVKAGTPLGGLITQNPLQHQVSSGPFKLAAFRYRSQLTFVPNPGYYAYHKMKLRRVDMPFIADIDTAYQGYESGQYAMAVVPDNRLAGARQQPDFHSSPLLAISYIAYNVSKAPFANRALRLATNYAINRNLIDDMVLHGADTPLYSLVPAGLPGYDADGQAVVPHYDPAKARRYLALAHKEMGTHFPASVTITYRSDAADLARIFTELQYEWKQIGLHVRIQPITPAIWLSLIIKPTPSLSYRGGAPWVQMGWAADYPDAQDFTTILLSPTSPYNVGNYDNPRFEALIARAETTRGPARAQLYVQASRLALNDGAVAMLGQPTTSWRWHRTITGLALWSGQQVPAPHDGDWTAVDVR